MTDERHDDVRDVLRRAQALAAERHGPCFAGIAPFVAAIARSEAARMLLSQRDREVLERDLALLDQ